MFLSFYYRLKFEWNLSVNTFRSGTSICSLICDCTQKERVNEKVITMVILKVRSKFNPIWYGLEWKKKCPSSAPPRGNFYKP